MNCFEWSEFLHLPFGYRSRISFIERTRCDDDCVETAVKEKRMNKSKSNRRDEASSQVKYAYFIQVRAEKCSRAHACFMLLVLKFAGEEIESMLVANREFMLG